MSEQLELFSWTPPAPMSAAILVIPPARRMKDVRLHARVLLYAKEKWRADLYWQRVVEKAWAELRGFGLPPHRCEAEISALTQAVVLAMGDTPSPPSESPALRPSPAGEFGSAGNVVALVR